MTTKITTTTTTTTNDDSRPKTVPPSLPNTASPTTRVMNDARQKIVNIYTPAPTVTADTQSSNVCLKIAATKADKTTATKADKTTMARRPPHTKEPLKVIHPADKPRRNMLPTPVRPHRLQHHLETIGYKKELTHYLVSGFTSGFALGHTQDAENINSHNSKNAELNSAIVHEKLKKEIQAGRILGPFDAPPFNPFQVSPLNVRPKKTPNKFRLLHNLSHPYDGRSINANIPESNKSVQYSTVGDAIQKLLKLPKSAYTAKTDISDAFRLIPIKPSDYPKLGMKFLGKFYYDRCLPQGCGSSCQIFETFSSAIHAIFEAYAPDAVCVHMLDDFFVIAENEVTQTPRTPSPNMQ